MGRGGGEEGRKGGGPFAKFSLGSAHIPTIIIFLVYQRHGRIQVCSRGVAIFNLHFNVFSLYFMLEQY